MYVFSTEWLFYIKLQLLFLAYIYDVDYEEFEDANGAIRIRISKKNKQDNGQKIEDAKGAIRIRISKKNKQDNGQKIIDAKGAIRIRISKTSTGHNGRHRIVVWFICDRSLIFSGSSGFLHQ